MTYDVQIAATEIAQRMQAEIKRLNDMRGEQDLEINKLRGENERLRALVKVWMRVCRALEPKP